MAGAATSFPENEIEAIPENLLREPLDYLSADHFRQRVICRFLDQIAFDPEGEQACRLAAVAADYLERDLPQHVADEEEGLLKRLRQRCGSEDKIDRLFALLGEEHERDEDLGRQLIAGLRVVAAGGLPSDAAAFCRLAGIFAEAQRRHLAWEEATLLPLARQKLTADDLTAIGRQMAKRRGLTYPD